MEASAFAAPKYFREYHRLGYGVDIKEDDLALHLFPHFAEALFGEAGQVDQLAFHSLGGRRRAPSITPQMQGVIHR